MGFLIVLFAIAMMMWFVPIARSGRMFSLALAVLGVGTVLGPSFFSYDGPIQISLDRMLFFMMMGLAAIGWRLGYVSVPKLTRIDWVVVSIVGFFFISASRGPDPATGTPPIARWLFYIAMPAGMYVVMRMVKINSRDIRYLLTGAIGLGVYLAITAVLEISGAHAIVFPRFIVDSEVWEFYGRGRGPLLNPSGNGILISLGLVAATLGFMKATYHRKAIYACLIICLLAGIYATLTRSAWLGGVAAIGIIFLAHSPRWVRVMGIVGVLVLIGSALTGLNEQLIRMKRDKNLSAADAEKSVKLRPLLAVVAWEMFKDRPITGFGYGHYKAHDKPYHAIRSYGLPLEQARKYYQHNVFLSILVDTGLIGLLLLISWMVILVSYAWRMARDRLAEPEARWVGWLFLGFLVAYLCNGMFQDATIIPMVHMYLFFLAGITVTVWQSGLAAVPLPERRSPQPARPVQATA